MPLSEIEERFTTSELILMAWRSRERGLHFKQKMKKARGGNTKSEYINRPSNNEDESGQQFEVGETGKKRRVYDGHGPEVMPDHFFDEEGDFNLSKVTGREARKYFEQVLRLPMPEGVSRTVAPDVSPYEQSMREGYGRRR